jgi:hypothetical protein
MDKIYDIIEAGELEMKFIYLDFIEKMFRIECKAINLNPYLNYKEKSILLDIEYKKTKKIINES